MASPLLSLRFSIRQLRKSPGFALTAILTLALGIGAAVSVFSVVNAVLLKPFAFRDPAKLVVVRESVEEMRAQEPDVPDNYRHFLRLKSSTRTLADAAIFQNDGPSVSTGNGHPRIVPGLSVSADFFRVFGVTPILGREFDPHDVATGAPKVVILSYAGWQSLFDGDPGVLGKTLRLGGDPTTVIGVMPAGFNLPQIRFASYLTFSENSANVQTNMVFEPLTETDRNLQNDTGNYNFKVVGRLKPGVTVAQAQAELNDLQHTYTRSAHLSDHLGALVTPLASDVTSGISGSLWLLFAAVGIVLLIACANLANLQLARAVAAEREIAVRAALGASRGQLIMVRLTESFLLAAIGGVAGVALAFAGVRFILAAAPSNVPRLPDVQVNLPVLAFALGLTAITALLFGTLPALQSMRAQPQAALQAHSSRTVGSQQGSRVRNLLVAGEVAFTVVLLMIAGLVLRSFSHLLTLNRGFDTSHVLAAQVDLFSPQYGDTKPGMKVAKRAFVDRALASLQQLPGVQSVSLSNNMPLTGQTWVDNLTRPDHPTPNGQGPLINIRWTDPQYLPTMRVSLVSGRNFTAADRRNPYVALISEQTAREGFPGEDPIGKQISNIVPDYDHAVTVVGVVANTRVNGLKDTADMVYLPYWSFTPWTLTFLVRSSQSVSALGPEVRQALWKIDPDVPIPSIKSLDDQLTESVAGERFQTLLLSCFGAAALLLALLGVYGVLAYSVSLRQQEFGIRIALGSDKGRLMALVLRQAAWPVLAGAGAGMTLAFVATRGIRSLLYQTQLVDPVAIAGSLVLLAVAATLAAILPARRASRVDPIEVLRSQ
jgi:putative ABC transport system permease protein